MKKANPIATAKLLSEIFEIAVIQVSDEIGAQIRLDTIKLLLNLSKFSDRPSIFDAHDAIKVSFQPTKEKVGKTTLPRISVFVGEDSRAALLGERLNGTHFEYPNIPIDAMVPILLPELEEFYNLEEEDEEIKKLQIKKILLTPVEDLNLSIPTYNYLKKAKINTLSDLVQFSAAGMLKFRFFRKKHLVEIEQMMQKKNLTFEMDVTKYGIEKNQI